MHKVNTGINFSFAAFSRSCTRSLTEAFVKELDHFEDLRFKLTSRALMVKDKIGHLCLFPPLLDLLG